MESTEYSEDIPFHNCVVVSTATSEEAPFQVGKQDIELCNDNGTVLDNIKMECSAGEELKLSKLEDCQLLIVNLEDEPQVENVDHQFLLDEDPLLEPDQVSLLDAPAEVRVVGIANDSYNIDICPNQLLNKYLSQHDVDYAALPRQQEVLQLKQSVEQVVSLVANKVKSMDPIFSCSVIPCGSFYEGVKVKSPDEFDFMLELDLLSKPEVCSVVPVPPNKIPRAKLDHPIQPRSFAEIELLDNDVSLSCDSSMVYADSNRQLLSPSLVQQKFKKLVQRALKQIVLPEGLELLIARSPTTQDVLHHYCELSGPAVTLHLLWRKEIPVSVDLTLAIHFLDWPSMSDFGRRLESSHPSYQLHQTIRMLGYHVVVSGSWWRMSFSVAEKLLVSPTVRLLLKEAAADPDSILAVLHHVKYSGEVTLADISLMAADIPCRCLRVLKSLRDLKTWHDEGSKSLLSTYLLKTSFLQELEDNPDEELWLPSEVSVRSLNLLSRLQQSGKNQKISSYFIPSCSLGSDHASVCKTADQESSKVLRHLENKHKELQAQTLSGWFKANSCGGSRVKYIMTVIIVLFAVGFVGGYFVSRHNSPAMIDRDKPETGAVSLSKTGDRGEFFTSSPRTTQWKIGTREGEPTWFHNKDVGIHPSNNPFRPTQRKKDSKTGETLRFRGKKIGTNPSTDRLSPRVDNNWPNAHDWPKWVGEHRGDVPPSSNYGNQKNNVHIGDYRAGLPKQGSSSSVSGKDSGSSSTDRHEEEEHSKTHDPDNEDVPGDRTVLGGRISPELDNCGGCHLTGEGQRFVHPGISETGSEQKSAKASPKETFDEIKEEYRERLKKILHNGGFPDSTDSRRLPSSWNAGDLSHFPENIPNVPDSDNYHYPDYKMLELNNVKYPEYPDTEYKIPEVNMPEVPDVNVPEVPDVYVPEMPEVNLPKVPEVHVPEVPEVPEIPRIPIEI